MKREKKLTPEEELDLECGVTNDISGEILRNYAKDAVEEKEKYFFQRIIPRINGLLIQEANKGYLTENFPLSKVVTCDEFTKFYFFGIVNYSDKIIQYYEKKSIKCNIDKTYDIFFSFDWGE